MVKKLNYDCVTFWSSLILKWTGQTLDAKWWRLLKSWHRKICHLHVSFNSCCKEKPHEQQWKLPPPPPPPTVWLRRLHGGCPATYSLADTLAGAPSTSIKLHPLFSHLPLFNKGKNGAKHGKHKKDAGNRKCEATVVSDDYQTSVSCHWELLIMSVSLHTFLH